MKNNRFWLHGAVNQEMGSYVYISLLFLFSFCLFLTGACNASIWVWLAMTLNGLLSHRKLYLWDKCDSHQVVCSILLLFLVSSKPTISFGTSIEKYILTPGMSMVVTEHSRRFLEDLYTVLQKSLKHTSYEWNPPINVFLTERSSLWHCAVFPFFSYHLITI